MVIANLYFGYVLGSIGSVWEYSTQSNTFTALPTNVTFKEIATQEGTFKYNNVTVPEVYGLTSAGSIYKESCAAFNSLTGQCSTEGPWVLVSGVTALHIALGRDYNVFAGTSSGLSQFFGSMTKTSQITGVRAGNYISQNANFTFSNFAPGGGVGGSGFGKVTNSCSGVLFSYTKLFGLDEGRFYTQAKFTSIDDCHSDPKRNNAWVCDYNVTPYCTVATTPPNWQVKGVIDSDFSTPPYGWDTWGECFAIKWFDESWLGEPAYTLQRLLEPLSTVADAFPKWNPIVAATCDNRKPGQE